MFTNLRIPTIRFLHLFASLFLMLNVSAQEGNGKYMVFFNDKKNVEFDPYEYFDARAIERRLKQGIPLIDSTDFPVREEYIDAVASLADSVSYASRWLNAVTVFAGENAMEKIAALSCVSGFEQISAELLTAGNDIAEYNVSMTAEQRRLLNTQTKRLGVEQFHAQGFNGKGIRIAIFDAGFPTADVNPCFEKIRSEGRLIKTFDFGKKRDHVFAYSAHGTNVLSCVGGMVDTIPIGLATGAEFLLARTENAFHEPFSEEENWLAAVEWADKNGADIINSSLGYTRHRYFREEMNGNISLISRAANIAARKGILVVNAAGNEGESGWKFIATPGDADSVLTVGGIDPDTDIHIGFSSFGPTADRRMKPNVVAYGSVIAAGRTGMVLTHGTSFASPLVAGFAACAWQSNPNLTNMELFRKIEQSASLYPYFDYAHGYGIPQAEYFLAGRDSAAATFDIFSEGKLVMVVINDANIDMALGDKLYYHIKDESGILDEYSVVRITDKKALKLEKSRYDSGKKLVIFYKGYSSEYVF